MSQQVRDTLKRIRIIKQLLGMKVKRLKNEGGKLRSTSSYLVWLLVSVIEWNIEGCVKAHRWQFFCYAMLGKICGSLNRTKKKQVFFCCLNALTLYKNSSYFMFIMIKLTASIFFFVCRLNRLKTKIVCFVIIYEYPGQNVKWSYLL